MSGTDERYRRVYMTGTLTLKSDLHIGTGGREAYPVLRDGKAEAHEFNTVLLDKDKHPYIPGSSLRGLLADLSGGIGYKFAWFGSGRGLEADHGMMGALRIYDARLEGKAACHLLSRTAIDAVTGTAAQHQLATYQRVDAGTKFRMEMVWDTKPGDRELITLDGIQELLRVLASLNGAQLGTGKSVGQGVLAWSLVKLEGISETGFSAWLQNNLRSGGSKKGKPPEFNRYQPLVLKPITLPAAIPAGDGVKGDWPAGWHGEAFTLQPEGAILINNPHDQEVQDKYNPQIPAEGQIGLANLVFLHDRDKQEAIIPGATLKGWFRAHCRRILLTLVQDRQGGISDVAEKKVDNTLNQLFGGVDTGQSLVRFYDARLRFGTADVYMQTFNAIDRFTGGVKDTALYSAKCLRTRKAFAGHMACHQAKMDEAGNGWMNLLLLFAWRDAEEGDLVLGWGKSKGYGKVTLKLVGDSWRHRLENLSDETLTGWETQLHARLGIGQETTA